MRTQELAADFLDQIGSRQLPQTIPAGIVKLLPCPAHRMLRPISDLRFVPICEIQLCSKKNGSRP
jgi:hypothetical protein